MANTDKKQAAGFFEYISKQELEDFRANKPRPKGQYNLTISPGYAIKTGFWSLDIDARAFDAIQKMQIGGRLIFKVRTPETTKRGAPSPQQPRTKAALTSDELDI